MTEEAYDETQVTMTLSAMAYEEDLATLRSMLAKPKYATQGRWELAWGPASGDLTAYSMFVARNTTTGDLAVTVRGSVLSSDHLIQTAIDWFNDLKVTEVVPFSDEPKQGRVAEGTAKALEVLLGLEDPTTGVRFPKFMEGAGAARILVTGHSLGGCQASALTQVLRDRLGPGPSVVAYTFAAPTPGDADFARTVGASDFNRIWNEWDFIPQAFEKKTLEAAGRWYPKPGPGMGLEVLIYDFVKDLPPTPNPYAQPAGAGTRLANRPVAKSTFLAEVAAQHDHNMYLRLLQAPSVP